MQIDRLPYIERPAVKQLINANVRWDGNGDFSWSVKVNDRGFNIRKKILPILLEMTKRHCAFCDFYPLSPEILNPIPIEHFYPKCKDKYPEKAYLWDNLYPVCFGCTDSKKDKFDEKLLKPDDPSYVFEKYFMITGDGKICPSNYGNQDEIERSKRTIEIYKLNRGYLWSERKKCYEDYFKLVPINNIDQRSFRFLIPIIEKTLNPDDIINKFLS